MGEVSKPRSRYLVASINFHPDHAGIAVYSTGLASFLAGRGYPVSVVTGFPYYPQWSKRPEDRGRLGARDSFEGASVYRGYLYVPERPTVLKRVLHDLSFCLLSVVSFLRAGKQDCIVVMVPPILLSVVAFAFARLWRARFVVHVQDLQLDAAVNLGMMKRGGLAGILRRVERWVYRRADLVVPISDGMARLIQAKGVDPQRMLVVPNWIDLERASVPVKPGVFRARHQIPEGEFLIAYAGNLGVKQGIDILLEAAAEIPRDVRIQVLIIGDGADRARLQALATERGVPTVRFLPLLSSSEYQEMLTDADLLFIGQRPGVDEVFFPSKLLGILARARPVLIAADMTSELAAFVLRAECGLVVPWGDRHALLQAMLKAERDRASLQGSGAAGRRAVEALDSEVILRNYVARLERSA